jgi:uncharacterized protein YndB with AHSA1/START domain
MSADRIEQEILIAAAVERVWAVLTEPEHVGQWFGQGKPAEVDLRPGGIMRLDHGENGDFPTTIVKVDPPNYLSYRWASAHPGETATKENATLVEFTLTAEGTGTRLHLVESGFASLTIPADRTGATHESHSGGWPDALSGLRKYAEQNAA